MLRQRIVTAVILLAVLGGALALASPWPLMVLLTLAAGCVGWEWLRLSLAPAQQRMAVPLALATAVGLLVLGAGLINDAVGAAGLLVLDTIHTVVVPLVALSWLFGASAVVIRANTARRQHTIALSAFGLLAVVALWYSMNVLFLAWGAWYLVSMMALVWVADSLAYFTGRALGRHRLAPAVSPGKTWEGALGGLAGGLIWMVATADAGTSFSAVLVESWGMAMMLLISALLVAVSIVGDLFESLLKRRAGVKDSSQLLPGHGGVYDRLDALFPVAPLALLLSGV